MPTISRYLVSTTNLPAIFKTIQDGVPPDKFNIDHLKAIGFGGSNDRAVVPLLKDLGFLSADGTPTQRYRDYRDSARARAVMGQALREAYSDLFVINENISKSDRAAVVGRFKALHDSSDVVAGNQARTFFALLDLADPQPSPSNGSSLNPSTLQDGAAADHTQDAAKMPAVGIGSMPLTYRFEIQLPATKDVEVFRAIFKAMREELING